MPGMRRHGVSHERAMPVLRRETRRDSEARFSAARGLEGEARRDQG